MLSILSSVGVCSAFLVSFLNIPFGPSLVRFIFLLQILLIFFVILLHILTMSNVMGKFLLILRFSFLKRKNAILVDFDFHVDEVAFSCKLYDMKIHSPFILRIYISICPGSSVIVCFREKTRYGLIMN